MEKTQTPLRQATVKLAQIAVSASNPRKEFDKESINELAASIREKGVLQPILLRPQPGSKDSYELVCGERRYRASKIVQKEFGDRDSIPAVIRELSDDEALELQIIENLQRRNVHPLDEAVAFSNLARIKSMSAVEIAKRIGKTPHYVAERLKLNDLIPEFQKAFYGDSLTMVDALRISKLAADDQLDFWNSENFAECAPHEKFDVNDYSLKRYSNDLNDPPFDPSDASLVPTMGACSSCQFNTGANTLLFPEAATASKCLNSGCYKDKTKLSLAAQLEQVVKDPSVAVVSGEFTLRKKGKDLLKKGVTVYPRGEYEVLDKPEPFQEPEEYQADLKDGRYDTEEEMRQAMKEDAEEFQKDLEEYENKVKSGKYKRAFVAEGRDAGKYVYVKLKPNAGKSAAEKPVTAEDQAVMDIKADIARIKDNLAAGEDADQVALRNTLADIVVGSKKYHAKRDTSNTEFIAQALFLLDSLHYGKIEQKVRKHFGLSGNGDLRELILAKLQQMKSPVIQSHLTVMWRLVMENRVLTDRSPYTVKRTLPVVTGMAAELQPEAYKKACAASDKAAAERETKAKESIAKLQQKLKALKSQPAATKEEKAPTPAKARKKGLSHLLN